MWPSFIGIFKEYFTCADTMDIFYNNTMIQSVTDVMIKDDYRFFFKILWFSLAYYPYTIQSCKVHED